MKKPKPATDGSWRVEYKTLGKSAPSDRGHALGLADLPVTVAGDVKPLPLKGPDERCVHPHLDQIAPRAKLFAVKGEPPRRPEHGPPGPAVEGDLARVVKGQPNVDCAQTALAALKGRRLLRLDKALARVFDDAGVVGKAVFYPVVKASPFDRRDEDWRVESHAK